MVGTTQARTKMPIDEVSEEQRRALATFVKLARATEAVMKRVHEPLAERGLQAGELGVLDALVHAGPLSAGELAEKLLCSNANVTLLVDRLVKRELVRRERDPLDRRKVHVQATPAGRRLFRKVFPDHARRIEAEFAVLTAQEVDQLAYLLRRLGRGREAG